MLDLEGKHCTLAFTIGLVTGEVVSVHRWCSACLHRHDERRFLVRLLDHDRDLPAAELALDKRATGDEIAQPIADFEVIQQCLEAR
jgi:hypothetical protein